MSLEALKMRLPEYAKDLKLNLASLAEEPALDEERRAGAFVAAAAAAGNPEVLTAVLAEFQPRIGAAAVAAAKTAAALMAMNNVYYRFVHLASAKDYAGMPARLRMNALARPGVDKAAFELWALAVSAVNGCGACIDAHERALRDEGVGVEAIQAAVRIAAVVAAVAATLRAEDAAAPALAA
jgi:alkyl hydroperoxide reductase subunit D